EHSSSSSATEVSQEQDAKPDKVLVSTTSAGLLSPPPSPTGTEHLLQGPTLTAMLARQEKNVNEKARLIQRQNTTKSPLLLEKQKKQKEENAHEKLKIWVKKYREKQKRLETDKEFRLMNAKKNRDWFEVDAEKHKPENDFTRKPTEKFLEFELERKHA
ncbi:unnamed protein product, partial [Amoebophrya sp. A120]